MKTLHVVNGDFTRKLLEASGLDDDIAVWREVLCEGPIFENVGSVAFYKERAKYISSNPEFIDVDYGELTVTELEKIKKSSIYDQVVLWFEYDLFCQINLIASCSLLLDNFSKTTKYYLVCVGKVEGQKRFFNLSEFKPDQYIALYNARTELSQSDLKYARNVWKRYCNKEFDNVEPKSIEQNAKFQYLQLALDQHTKRFCKAGENYNEIEKKIIELMKDGVDSKKELVKRLLNWQSEETVYGFGDTQYHMYIANLMQKKRPLE